MQFTLMFGGAEVLKTILHPGADPGFEKLRLLEKIETQPGVFRFRVITGIVSNQGPPPDRPHNRFFRIPIPIHWPKLLSSRDKARRYWK